MVAGGVTFSYSFFTKRSHVVVMRAVRVTVTKKHQVRCLTLRSRKQKEYYRGRELLMFDAFTVSTAVGFCWVLYDMICFRCLCV